MQNGIVESARGRLRSSPYSALEEIARIDRGGALELVGDVPSGHLKQVARRPSLEPRA